MSHRRTQPRRPRRRRPSCSRRPRSCGGGTRAGPAAALQGVALAAIPSSSGRPQGDVVLVGVGWRRAALRGGCCPGCCRARCVPSREPSGESDPLVNTTASLLAVAVLTVARLSRSAGPLVDLDPTPATRAAPAAFAVVLIGVFVLVSRRRALSQAVGFLDAGQRHRRPAFLITAGVPLIVELGASLDILFAVLILRRAHRTACGTRSAAPISTSCGSCATDDLPAPAALAGAAGRGLCWSRSSAGGALTAVAHGAGQRAPSLAAGSPCASARASHAPPTSVGHLLRADALDARRCSSSSAPSPRWRAGPASATSTPNSRTGTPPARGARLYGALVALFLARCRSRCWPNNLGVVWVADRGDDGRHGVPRRAPAHPRRAGGDLEVRRSSARSASRSPSSAPCCSTSPARHAGAGQRRARLRRAAPPDAAPARPGGHPARRRAAAARLRRQGRPRAVPHLARRRPQPGPCPGLRADERRAAVGGVLRAAAHQVRRRPRARHRLPARRAADRRAADARGRRLAAGRATRLQADARLLLDGEHGPDRHRRRGRHDAGHRRAAAARARPRHRQDACCSSPPASCRHAHDSTAIADVTRGLARVPLLGDRVRRRPRRAARAAAVRHVRQRDRPSARGLGAAHLAWALGDRAAAHRDRLRRARRERRSMLLGSATDGRSRHRARP